MLYRFEKPKEIFEVKMLTDIFIDWKKVTNILEELSRSSGSLKIENIINEQVINMVKETHPNNYEEIILKSV